MADKELEIQITQLIAKDEIEEAIALLSKHFAGNEKLKAIVLQSGRFHSLKKDQANGVVDYATVQQTLNQLRANILGFLSTIPDEPSPSPNPGKPKARDEFRPAFARVATLLILAKTRKEQEGLTITDIFGLSQSRSRKHIYEAIKAMEENGLVEKQKKGNKNYWKLSAEGTRLAEEFEKPLQFILQPE